tara:strand:- start:867 stop:1856 length:990 start_codon:yes stop_codon:yes gene_type:complete
MNKNDKVFIIGGLGFLGSRVVSRLIKKNIPYQVGDIVNCSKKNIKLNIEDLDSLDQIAESNTIINLAAVHRDDVRPLSLYDAVNVEGSRNICKAARKHKINRIIFTSSVAVYGLGEKEMDESSEINYFNDYGRTKYLAEQIYKKWYEEDPINRTLVIIRPTVIFGEGNRGNVYNLLKQIASKRFVMFGNGKNPKSMAYVENVASFLEYSLNFKPGLHIYNYVDKPDLDMNSLISETRNILFKKNNVGFRLPAFLGIAIGLLGDLISKVFGKTVPINSIRVKKFMGTTKFSSSASKTGFVPSVTLREGLIRTIRYEFLENNTEETVFKKK